MMARYKVFVYLPHHTDILLFSRRSMPVIEQICNDHAHVIGAARHRVEVKYERVQYAAQVACEPRVRKGNGGADGDKNLRTQLNLALAEILGIAP